MGLKTGIVGLPNAGKSTIFNALTQSGIPAENYPFCTINPNVGIVSVPDPRLYELANIFKPMEITPATMEFVDIAGLVKGASQGEGAGGAGPGRADQRTTGPAREPVAGRQRYADARLGAAGGRSLFRLW